jgi:phosphate transport system substrate-binding protein
VRLALGLVLLACAVLAAAGCGRSGRTSAQIEVDEAAERVSGKIEADGSSTVAPLLSAAAEEFQRSNPDARVTVGVAGTGGGFERFCAGETDLSSASRPIKDEEAAACREKGIEPIELQVANDALTVVVNSDNDWVECLTLDQLKRVWEPGSKVGRWDAIDPSFPREPLRLFGPGTDSGTFDYFTDEVVGEEGASRSDYSASEDDNVVVEGVGGERGGLGYFGFSYYDQNRGRLKAVAIDGGEGCVEPSVETAQSGRYALARPLFVYAKRTALARREVRAFLDFILENADALAERTLFVPMTAAQVDEARAKLGEPR